MKRNFTFLKLTSKIRKMIKHTKFKNKLLVLN